MTHTHDTCTCNKHKTHTYINITHICTPRCRGTATAEITRGTFLSSTKKDSVCFTASASVKKKMKEKKYSVKEEEKGVGEKKGVKSLTT
jgi:hypothetical protein